MRRLFAMLAILGTSLAMLCPVFARADDSEPSVRECAAYYLTIEDQLNLYTAIVGKPPVTLGPATAWAHRQLSQKALAASPLTDDPSRRPLDELAAATDNDLAGAMHRPGYLSKLQRVVDHYDGPCQQLSGQKPLNLAVLAEGVPPVPPSELECAAYYGSIAAQFASETELPKRVMQVLDPIAKWIEAKQHAADGKMIEAARGSFARNVSRLAEQDAARNGGLFRIVIHYYDPLCSPVSGLPSIDLDSMSAAAVSPN